ncbi:MAG TPA: PAS domain S-box protein [Geminocystis sp. M7585_C2015_104]|nr:PAS domain S-box protein [Geminocystis sp. M7585_C2015_104]
MCYQSLPPAKVVDSNPVYIPPETPLMDVVRKLASGCDILIVFNDCHPLGYISPPVVLKQLHDGHSFHSLCAGDFCQDFPSVCINDSADIFAIAHSIYTNKTPVYGCWHQGKFQGIITAKSLCGFLRGNSFYSHVSVLEIFEANLKLLPPESNILSLIRQLEEKPKVAGFLLEEKSQNYRVFTPYSFLRLLSYDNWQNKTIVELPAENFPCVSDNEKITSVLEILDNYPYLLITRNLEEARSRNGDICPQFCLVNHASIIKILSPSWQYQFLQQQQQTIIRLKTAFGLEKRQFEREKLLSQISQRIRQTLNLDTLLDNTVTEIRNFLDCDRVIVYQLHPEGDGIVVAESVKEGITSIKGRVVRDHCFVKDFTQPYLGGRIQAVDDIFQANLSPCYRDLLLSLQVQANLVVPIIFHESLWGLLAAQNCKKPRHWQEEELNLLQQLAYQLAIALQQGEYAQKTKEIARYQTAIVQLAKTALVETDIQKLLDTAVGIVGETLKVEFIAIHQLQSNQACFLLKAGKGWKPEWLGKAQISKSPRWLPGYTLQVMQPVVTEDLLVETRFSPCPLLHNSKIVSAATVPMGEKDNYYGVLGVYSQKPRKFNPEELDFLQTFANVLATAIEKIKSQRQLDCFFSLSPDIFCVMGMDGSFKRVNWSLVKTLGYPASEFNQKNILSFIHPEDIETTRQQLVKINQGFSSIGFENRWLTKDGDYRWLAWRCLFHEDGIIYAVARDVTQIKQNEAQLRDLNRELEDIVQQRTRELQRTANRLRAFVQTAGIIVIVLNQEYRIVEWNEEAERIFGWKRDCVMGEDYFSLLIPSSNQNSLKQIFAAAISTGKIQRNVETKVLLADGGERTIVWNINPFTDGNGANTGLIACGQDIEEVKLAQFRCRLSEERFRSIFHQAAVGIAQISLEGKFVLVNDKLVKMLGYNRGDLLNFDFTSLIHPEDVPPTLVDLSSLLCGSKITFEREIRIKCRRCKQGEKDNCYLWVNLTMSIVWVAVEPSYFIAVINDISDRKKAEESLQRSEARLNSILNSLQDVVWSFSLPSLRLRYINPACERVYGYPPQKILANHELLFDCIVPEHKPEVQQTWQEIMDCCHSGVERGKDKTWEIEYKIQLPDGDYRWLRQRAYIVYAQNGEVVSVDGIVTDVTERHAAEERLFKSLREKEILLKEIHHRVKNNLYVISSLLNLQAKYVKDEKVKSLFEDSQNRIQTMAIIHEQLYQSEDLSEIDFAQYLHRLVSNLSLSYTHHPTSPSTFPLHHKASQTNHPKITLLTDIQQCRLNIQTAIPAGLLVNELVTNAFKHAFPDNREGEVRISLGVEDTGEILLKVSDNGVGFPPDFNWEESDSLGLRLVRLLCQQLDASIEVISYPNQGVSFHISFYPSTG